MMYWWIVLTSICRNMSWWCGGEDIGLAYDKEVTSSAKEWWWGAAGKVTVGSGRVSQDTFSRNVTSFTSLCIVVTGMCKCSDILAVFGFCRSMNFVSAFLPSANWRVFGVLQWFRAEPIPAAVCPSSEVRVIPWVRTHWVPAAEGHQEPEDRTPAVLASSVSSSCRIIYHSSSYINQPTFPRVTRVCLYCNYCCRYRLGV